MAIEYITDEYGVVTAIDTDTGQGVGVLSPTTPTPPIESTVSEQPSIPPSQPPETPSGGNTVIPPPIAGQAGQTIVQSAPPAPVEGVKYYDANTRTWQDTGMSEQEARQANIKSGVFYSVGGQVLEKPQEAFTGGAFAQQNVPETYKQIFKVPEYAGLSEEEKNYQNYVKAGAPFGITPSSYVLETDWQQAADQVTAQKALSNYIYNGQLDLGKALSENVPLSKLIDAGFNISKEVYENAKNPISIIWNDKTGQYDIASQADIESNNALLAMIDAKGGISKAIESGDIASVRAAIDKGLYTVDIVRDPKTNEPRIMTSEDREAGLKPFTTRQMNQLDLVNLQTQVADDALRQRLTPIVDRYVTSTKDIDGSITKTVNLIAAKQAGVDASTLRLAGYPVSQEQYDKIQIQKPGQPSIIETPKGTPIDASVIINNIPENKISLVSDRVTSDIGKIPENMVNVWNVVKPVGSTAENPEGDKQQPYFQQLARQYRESASAANVGMGRLGAGAVGVVPTALEGLINPIGWATDLLQKTSQPYMTDAQKADYVTKRAIDFSGATSIMAGLADKDIFTGKQLNLPLSDRIGQAGMGTAQAILNIFAMKGLLATPAEAAGVKVLIGERGAGTVNGLEATHGVFPLKNGGYVVAPLEGAKIGEFPKTPTIINYRDIEPPSNILALARKLASDPNAELTQAEVGLMASSADDVGQLITKMQTPLTKLSTGETIYEASPKLTIADKIGGEPIVRPAILQGNPEGFQLYTYGVPESRFAKLVSDLKESSTAAVKDVGRYVTKELPQDIKYVFSYREPSTSLKTNQLVMQDFKYGIYENMSSLPATLARLPTAIAEAATRDISITNPITTVRIALGTPQAQAIVSAGVIGVGAFISPATHADASNIAIDRIAKDTDISEQQAAQIKQAVNNIVSQYDRQSQRLDEPQQQQLAKVAINQIDNAVRATLNTEQQQQYTQAVQDVEQETQITSQQTQQQQQQMQRLQVIEQAITQPELTQQQITTATTTPAETPTTGLPSKPIAPIVPIIPFIPKISGGGGGGGGGGGAGRRTGTMLVGVVVDKEKNTPIEKASVKLTLGKSKPLTATTNRNGIYRFSDLESGNYKAEASKEGYDSELVNFFVQIGENRLDFHLQGMVLQKGSIVWIQGRPRYHGESEAPMFKILQPPYEKIITTRIMPEGYVDEGYSGKGMAFKSIQVLGGLPDNNIENVDLGFAKVNINIESGKPIIEFVQDIESNTGARSKTVGQGKGQIPIEEWEAAKAKGIPFEEFVASYTGHKEGEPHPSIRNNLEILEQETEEINKPNKKESIVSETQNEPEAQKQETITETSEPELETNQEISEDTEPIKAQINELVTYLEKSGMQVEFVGNKTLHDYAGMNPEAAKTMGWQNRGNEIQIDKNLPIKRQLDNLRHEIVEMDLMKSGDSYADAHIVALQLEKVPLTTSQLAYLAGLGQYRVAHIHKNGNINVSKDGKEYSLTNDGQMKQIRLQRYKPEQKVEENQQAEEDIPMRKPKGMKNWWESSRYNNNVDTPLPENKYRGRSILPPQLGDAL